MYTDYSRRLLWYRHWCPPNNQRRQSTNWQVFGRSHPDSYWAHSPQGRCNSFHWGLCRNSPTQSNPTDICPDHPLKQNSLPAQQLIHTMYIKYSFDWTPDILLQPLRRFPLHQRYRSRRLAQWEHRHTLRHQELLFPDRPYLRHTFHHSGQHPMADTGPCRD